MKRQDEIFERACHEEKLGTLLWRTLNRLEQSLSDRTIDPARAREVIDLVSELAGGPASSGDTAGASPRLSGPSGSTSAIVLRDRLVDRFDQRLGIARLREHVDDAVAGRLGRIGRPVAGEKDGG